MIGTSNQERAVAAFAVVIMLASATSRVPAQDRTATDTPSRANAELVRDAFERWASGKGFFDQLPAPDVRWTIRGSGPLAKTYPSREAFIREAVAPFAARLARPVAPTIRHLVAQDDIVVAIWDGETTARDGAPYKNNYVWVFRLANGRAVEVEAFLDLQPYYDVLRVPSPEPLKQRSE
jgi:uncharacterized protein